MYAAKHLILGQERRNRSTPTRLLNAAAELPTLTDLARWGLVWHPVDSETDHTAARGQPSMEPARA
ncbi:MAG: hypothetical protein DLM61_16400 [Pseudonocardiales bacterium]|nr:MAG: hypothetical protein DLM61_16400 [Pseudonocardiales bacterium]